MKRKHGMNEDGEESNQPKHKKAKLVKQPNGYCTASLTASKSYISRSAKMYSILGEKSAKAIINTCFDNYNKLHIPASIANDIISYTQLEQIQHLWICIYHKLGPFAYMIKDPVTIQQIKTFESQCIINDYKLPSALRVSLMYCNFVQMPSIFKHSLQSPNDLDSLHCSEIILESFISPVSKWCPIEMMLHWPKFDAPTVFEQVQTSLYDFYDDEEKKATAQRMNQWFEVDTIDLAVVYNIGVQCTSYDDDLDDMPYIVTVWFNVKSNEILMHEMRYDNSDTHWWTVDEFFDAMCSINSSYIQSVKYELKDLGISVSDNQSLHKKEIEIWVKYQSNYDCDGKVIEKIVNTLL